MTLKIYRQAFSSVALASSVLLTSWAASGAVASTGNLVNGLSGHDLVNGRVSLSSSGSISNEGLSAAQLGISPTKAQSPAFAKAGRFSPERSAEGATPLVQHSSSSSVVGSGIVDPSAVESMLAQQGIELAQEVGDTFSPLTEEEIRQRLLIDPDATTALDRPRAVPSSTFLTPTAYGADWGDAYIGLAGAAGGNSQRNVDGSASLGMGFGNAVNNVGVEVSAGIISLDGFADDGIVGFKLHKVFPRANNLAVAAGWANPIKWGAANNEEDTFYGVVTQQFALRPNRANTLPLTASLGVGTGTFRSKGARAAGDNAPNVFGSVGLRVIPQLSLTSSWTGSELGFAASAAPFEFPLVFTAGVSDITDNTAEGTRFQGSMGYSFSF